MRLSVVREGVKFIRNESMSSGLMKVAEVGE